MGGEAIDIRRRDAEGAAEFGGGQFAAGDGAADGALGEAEPRRRLAGGQQSAGLVASAVGGPVRRPLAHGPGSMVDADARCKSPSAGPPRAATPLNLGLA